MQESAAHAPQEPVGRQILGFCIYHWEKAAILAFLITLIILVCVKVWTVLSAQGCSAILTSLPTRLSSCSAS